MLVTLAAGGCDVFFPLTGQNDDNPDDAGIDSPIDPTQPTGSIRLLDPPLFAGTSTGIALDVAGDPGRVAHYEVTSSFGSFPAPNGVVLVSATGTASVELLWNAPEMFAPVAFTARTSYAPSLSPGSESQTMQDVRQQLGNTSPGTGTTVIANTVIAFPIDLPTMATLINYGITVQGTSAMMIMGLYDGVKGPTTLINETSPFAIPSSMQTIEPPALATTLGAGRYWLALIADVSVQISSNNGDLGARAAQLGTFSLPATFPASVGSPLAWGAYLTVGP